MLRCQLLMHSALSCILKISGIPHVKLTSFLTSSLYTWLFHNFADFFLNVPSPPLSSLYTWHEFLSPPSLFLFLETSVPQQPFCCIHFPKSLISNLKLNFNYCSIWEKKKNKTSTNSWLTFMFPFNFNWKPVTFLFCFQWKKRKL